MNALLAHRVSGSGPPLLLLNGIMMSYTAWDPLVDVLTPTYTVVGCDFRGQLRSPGTPPARLDGHVADVVALFDALALPRAHVVGTSFGGLVSLLLAASHPERVATLTVVTATTHMSADAWAGVQPVIAAARAAQAGGDPRAVFDALVPSAFAPAFRMRHAAALELRRRQFSDLPPAWFEDLPRLIAALEGLDLRPHIGRIRAPTLIVGAELDATFPVASSRALADAIPDARLEVVPGAGHALVVEDSPALATLVQNFLAGPAARAAVTGGRTS